MGLFSLYSILNNLILVTIKTVVGKKLQFNRAVLRHYSLLTSDFKHGDETRDNYVMDEFHNVRDIRSRTIMLLRG